MDSFFGYSLVTFMRNIKLYLEHSHLNPSLLSFSTDKAAYSYVMMSWRRFFFSIKNIF